MSKVVDLGTLINLANVGVQPPKTYEGINNAAQRATMSDDEVARRAVEDSKIVPSVWFVNFPTVLAQQQQHLLRQYEQSIMDYRSWASLVWWRTVFSAPEVPQDASQESITIRSAYCARVATQHMKTTPWLAMNVDQNQSQTIECRVEDFHKELISAVLAGFVAIPAVIEPLEQILQSLTRTISQTSSSSQNKTIVLERYEYMSLTNEIRSYVRLVSFAVTEDMRNVQNAKQTEARVRCTIDYNDYEANFNQRLWNNVAATIEAQQIAAALDFVNQQTIDCPP